MTFLKKKSRWACWRVANQKLPIDRRPISSALARSLAAVAELKEVSFIGKSPSNTGLAELFLLVSR